MIGPRDYVLIQAGHKMAKISRSDIDLVAYRSWSIGAGYAVSCGLRMHRLILGQIDHGMVVDHKSGDKLDNRRENLRVCTPSQNAKNKRKAFTMSQFKGVTKSGNKFFAKITSDGDTKNLGSFDDAISAALAYDAAAARLHGEYASPNFPVSPLNKGVKPPPEYPERPRITKAELLAALGITKSKLSEVLEITRQAVSQWPDDEPIPELQWLRLKDRRPKMLQRAIEAHVMGVRE